LAATSELPGEFTHHNERYDRLGGQRYILFGVWHHLPIIMWNGLLGLAVSAKKVGRGRGFKVVCCDNNLYYSTTSSTRKISSKCC
jgi:hypothetical protein